MEPISHTKISSRIEFFFPTMVALYIIHGRVNQELYLPPEIVLHPTGYHIGLVGYSFVKADTFQPGFHKVYCNVVADQFEGVTLKPILGFIAVGGENSKVKNVTEMVTSPIFVRFDMDKVRSTRFRCYLDDTEKGIGNLGLIIEIRKVAGD